jgi:fumarylacetoacetase
VIPSIDETHDPALRCWVESALGHAEFPIQNLPFGVFRRAETTEPARVGVAIGEMIFDIAAARRSGHFSGESASAARACEQTSLNALMAGGRAGWSSLRRALSKLLRVESGLEREAQALLVPMKEAELLLPATVGDYSDFYASVHHATNVGSMFRPDNPLLPNYKYVPIGYHGRASSLVPSGTPVRRPRGQRKAPDEAAPTFGPTRSLDYECEIGAFVGPGNMLGEPIDIRGAGEQIFGLCLVNDWSARDIQSWEYQPLGPFLAKSFATTLSPWVVTMDALAPFRAPAASRGEGDPAPLDYLRDDDDAARGGVDVVVEVGIRSRAMRQRGEADVRVSHARFADMYWTPGQMVAHHASNGCNLRPGDLIASGTISGPERDARGCLLELTWRGAEPISLPGGEKRSFLEDGDEVVLRGRCQRPGHAQIGFGECRGTILAAS